MRFLNSIDNHFTLRLVLHTCKRITICVYQFQLLYQEKNLGVEYEYSIPKGAVQSTDPDGYSWIYNDYGPCSATCGGGGLKSFLLK